MGATMRALQMTDLKCALSRNIDYTSKRVSSSRRPEFASRASMKNGYIAVVVLADGAAANALTSEAYLRVLTKDMHILFAGGAICRLPSLSHAASETFLAAKDVAEQVVHTVKPAVDFVTPYVLTSADYVYKALFPAAFEFEKQADKAIQSSGYDTKPAVEVAKVIRSTENASSDDLAQEFVILDMLFPIQVMVKRFYS